MGRPKGQTNADSWLIANGKIGDQFYSEKEDKYLTALSSYYKRKILTERIIAISSGKKNPICKYIVKVTLL